MTHHDDALITEWTQILRDPDTRQTFGAYTDPDGSCARCAWGHNPHQNKIASRYGQRFRLSVEKLNDRHRWALPEIADYIDTELGQRERFDGLDLEL